MWSLTSVNNGGCQATSERARTVYSATWCATANYLTFAASSCNSPAWGQLSTSIYLCILSSNDLLRTLFWNDTAPHTGLPYVLQGPERYSSAKVCMDPPYGTTAV